MKMPLFTAGARSELGSATLILDSTNCEIADANKAIYAAFIVRACNSVERLERQNAALVAALEESTEALRRAIQHVPANAVNMEVALNSPIEDARTLGHCGRVLKQARAALALAKEGQP